MNPLILNVLIALATFPLTACGQPTVEQAPPPVEAEAPPAVVETVPATETDPAELLRNGKLPAEGVLTGGQPTPEQFKTLADLGYGTVVNLRTPGEKDNTDPALIESLGMRYVSLPIGGAETLNEQNARKLAEILGDAETPVVVHCASGNRVGGLLALKAYYVDENTPEEALAFGREAGMTRIEPLITQKLGLE